jgi:hypothetical protein
VLLAGLSVAVAALAPFASPAMAMPGDAEIANLAPAEFHQTPVTRGGLEVSFSCPAYRTGAAGGIADGGAADYSVRLGISNTGEDGRLPGPGKSGFLSEAPAQPAPGSSDCTSWLPLPATFGPPPLFLGPVDWQVARRCPGCGRGSESGPVSWAFLTPNIEAAQLTIPRRIYAGYLARFSFATTSDLSGASIGLQSIGGHHGWADLARTPFVPGAESVFFAKLPAGHHLLRIDAYANPVFQLGLPYQEVTVIKPGRHRATGAGDDGAYAAGAGQPPASFEVVGRGRRLLNLEAGLPLVCPGPSPLPTGSTLIARLGGARIAPDGTLLGRAMSDDEPPVYTTLEGRLRHRRFVGTVTAASGSCSGSREFRAALRSPAARGRR